MGQRLTSLHYETDGELQGNESEKGNEMSGRQREQDDEMRMKNSLIFHKDQPKTCGHNRSSLSIFTCLAIHGFPKFIQVM